MSLLVTWLFDQAKAKTVQAATETENEPMRRALEKLGFARAGSLREFGRDHVLYAVGASDWRGLPDQA
jgi:RimJ/RimL family protein N-acetyltransferase